VAKSHVILGDFSVLRHDSGLKFNHVPLYNNLFSAPELADQKPIGRTTDVYAIGKVLEYLMEHVGYRFGNEKQVNLSGIETKKIDYVLQAAIEFNPEKRVQSIEEIVDLMQHEVKNKELSFSIVKILMAGLLSVLAIYMVIQADLIPKFDEKETHAEPIVIHENPFKFVNTKVYYDFGEDILLSWVDEIDDVYTLELESDDYPCCARKIVTSDQSINLKHLGLNPGSYTIVLKKSDLETKERTIVIREDEVSRQVIKPNFVFEAIDFYSVDEMSIGFIKDDQMKTRVGIYNFDDNSFIEFIQTGNFVDLQILNLDQGEYRVSIQNMMNEEVSYHDHMSVRILDQKEVKCPTLITGSGAMMTSEGSIEWLPVSGKVHVKLVARNSDHTYEFEAETGMDSISLENHVLEAGVYDVFVRHVEEGESSRAQVIQVEIVE
jgi:hypothetical protein